MHEREDCMRAPLVLITIAALFFTSRALGAASERAYAPSVKITTVLKTSRTSLGEQLIYPKTNKPEITMLSVEIPPGTETGWHVHPIQGYAYVISGTLTVQTKNGTHVFHAGQGLVEPVNVLHDGKNLGKEPVKLIVLFTGERGQPYAIKGHRPSL